MLYFFSPTKAKNLHSKIPNVNPKSDGLVHHKVKTLTRASSVVAVEDVVRGTSASAQTLRKTEAQMLAAPTVLRA